MPSLRNCHASPHRSAPWIALCLLGSALVHPGQAQVIPDGTLPTNSQVNTTGNTSLITGGTERGVNLYHSFQQFSIPTGGEVWFDNGLQIETILTRVTGNFPSSIDGLIRANGAASLFLINPNGIVFGPDATLQIGGSFFATTAGSLRFFDGSEFSATHPHLALPLLTVNITPGLQYGSIARGSQISNQGTLSVGQTLTLVADQLEVPGTLRADKAIVLQAQDSVQISGFIDTSNPTGGDGGDITITAIEGDITIIGDETSLDDKANLDASSDASAFEFNDSGDGGTIALSAGRDIYNSGIFSSSSFALSGISGNGGTISLSAARNLTNSGSLSSGSSTFYANSSGNGGTIILSAGGDLTNSLGLIGTFSEVLDGNTGNGGTITLSAGRNLTNSAGVYSFLSSLSGSSGNGGTITFSAGGNLTNSGPVFSTPISISGISGNGGTITFSAGGNLTNENGLSTDSSGNFGTSGNGGTITLFASGDLINSGDLSSSTYAFPDTDGNGGAVILSAVGNLINSGALYAYSYSESGNSGSGGTIDLSTVEILTNSGSLYSYSYSPQGNSGSGGTIALRAPTGAILGDNSSILYSFSVAPDGVAGTGGAVTLDANHTIAGLEILTASSSSQSGTVSLIGRGDLTITSTRILTGKNVTINSPFFPDPITIPVGGSGRSGDVVVTSAGNLTFTDSRIDSNTQSNDPAGDITINSRGLVTFNNSQITSNTRNAGNAGNITVNALTGVTIADDSSGLIARSQGTGAAGNITVQTGTLELLNGGHILTDSDAVNGGNITISALDILLLRNNSLISATAGTVQAGGDGGNISITTPFIAAASSENTDITANAFSGMGGNIAITTNAIFGLAFQPQLTPHSDITASSQLGLNGSVTIRTPDIDPGQGTIELPSQLVDANELIARSCIVHRGSRQGRFVVTGTGGLPKMPDDLANAPFPTYSLPDRNQEAIGNLNSAADPNSNRENGEIAEIDGIYQLPSGEKVLGRSCQPL